MTGLRIRYTFTAADGVKEVREHPIRDEAHGEQLLEDAAALGHHDAEIIDNTETNENMTAREIAKALKVGTRTRDYVMRDLEGYAILGQYEDPRYARVLNSLGRSDTSTVTFRIRLVAIALKKSISTGRMHPVASMRIQSYTPYQLCRLVARIATECEESTIGGICDGWLAANHASL